MEDQELTSGVQDFFAETESVGKTGGIVGGVGAWILHLVVFAFAIYSGYHGISATSRYHGGGLGMAAGVVGGRASRHVRDAAQLILEEAPAP